MYMITRESIYYINLRQAYLLSPYYATRLSSRTVLFTSVPDEYLNETNLRRMLGESVERVWIPTDTAHLEDEVKERDKIAIKLEAAETKLIKAANAARLKAAKKKSKQAHQDIALEELTPDMEGGSTSSRYLSAKDRPTHRLKFLIGKKVDTIDWCRAELGKRIPEVQEMQQKHRALNRVKKTNAVFVSFTSLQEAQSAYQSLTHHQILHMAPRYTGMTPAEIIWSNLRIKWWERVLRVTATTSFVFALVVFWSFPVAAVGFISNLDNLKDYSHMPPKTFKKGFTWLNWLLALPSPLFGVVSGLLPTVALAVLMSLLPIILRLMARLGGDPSRSAVELTVQNTYFAFQVIQVFLVATLGSAASSALGSILPNHINMIPQLLASSIPKASNFYLSYFVLQGLAVVSGTLLNLTGLVLFLVLGRFLDNTPRKMYKRWVSLAGMSWGTVFPPYTNLFVIAICYAIIAPLVLLFAAAGLFLFYQVYKYQLLYAANADIDTKGRVYARALQQIFVGLYIAEGCLIGLFAINTGSSIGALGPLILMIIFMAFTALYHMSLNAALQPLINYLPKSLEAEERRLLDEESVAEREKGEKGMTVDTSKELVSSASNAKPPSMLKKFLRPDIYTNYASMRRMVPTKIDIRYEEEEESHAYYNPAITSAPKLLWIPRDCMGVSRQEVRETSRVIPITDEGASLDDKNKIIWDAEDGRPPIWERPVYY
jgi:MFS family permease